ncbi:MAG: hypothetical protein HY553_18690, partial [Elusimicrobia bacterium]|nr:hypothetical protein [Elusimicrobiota bacterium]
MAQAVADLAIGSESRQVRRSAVASLLAWEASERSPEVRAGLSTALSRIADFERARAESFEPSPPRAQPPPKRSWSWEAVFARAGLAAGALLSGGLAALLGATLTLALVGGFAWILGQLAGRLWRSESGVPEAAPGTGAILAALIPYGGVAIALLVSSPPSDALRLLPWVAGAGVGLGVLARTSLLDKLDADNRFIEAWLLSLVLPLAGLAVAGYQGGKAVGRALDRTAAATATPEPAPTAPPVATGVPAAAVNPAAPLKGLSMLVRSLLERPAWKDPWRAAGDLSDGAALAFMDPTVRPATAVLRRAVVASPDVDPAFWAKVSRSFDEPLAAALRRFADRVRGDPSSVGFLGMIQAYSREEHGLVGRTLRSAQDRTTRQALDRDVVLRLLASLDGSRRNRARNRRASNLATARALDRLDNVNVESLEPSTQRLLLAGLALAYAAEDEPFRARGLSAVLLSVSRRALLAERESALRLMLTAAESAPPGPPGLGRKLRAAQAAAGLAISGESAELRLAAAQALSAWERREHSENVRKGLASALSRIQDLETALAEASRPRPAQ